MDDGRRTGKMPAGRRRSEGGPRGIVRRLASIVVLATGVAVERGRAGETPAVRGAWAVKDAGGPGRGGQADCRYAPDVRILSPA